MPDKAVLPDAFPPQLITAADATAVANDAVGAAVGARVVATAGAGARVGEPVQLFDWEIGDVLDALGRIVRTPETVSPPWPCVYVVGHPLLV